MINIRNLIRIQFVVVLVAAEATMAFFGFPVTAIQTFFLVWLATASVVYTGLAAGAAFQLARLAVAEAYSAAHAARGEAG